MTDLILQPAGGPREWLGTLAERCGLDLTRQAGIVAALASGPVAALLYVATLCLAHGDR